MKGRRRRRAVGRGAARLWSLVSLLLMVGCSHSQAPQTSSETQSPTPNTRPPKTRITFLAMEYDPKTSEWERQLVSQFNKQSADVEVALEVVDWNDGHQILTTRLAGNQAPDLANVATIWVPEYAELSKLEPLERY